jgi:hypothetical protein
MTGRRRKWLIASALLAIVAALGWALLGRGGKMEAQLVFVGYTNKLVDGPPLPGQTIPSSFRTWEPIVLATNSGTAVVEISASIRSPNVMLTGTTIQYRDGFVAPLGPVPPRVLKPGETALIELEGANYHQPWFTEICAQRRTLSDRIYCKAWDSGNATVQRMMSRWLPALPEFWAQLGPITNPPPQTEPFMMEAWKKLETITKPLPDIEPVLDSMKPHPPRRPSPSLLDGGIYR